MSVQIANSVLVNNVTMRDIERMVERIVKATAADVEARLMEKLEKQQSSKPAVVEKEKSKTQFIKRIDAAKLLGVNVSTIDDWCKAGYLQCHRLGGRVYYTQSDLEEAMGLQVRKRK